MHLFIKCKLFFAFKITYLHNCCHRNLHSTPNPETTKYHIKNCENEFMINIDVSKLHNEEQKNGRKDFINVV